MSKYKAKINDKEIEVKLLEQNGAYLKFDVSGNVYEVNLESLLSSGADQTGQEVSGSGSGQKAVKSPMPGLIVKLAVKEKQEVKVNQLLLTIEAMKMENNIFSPVNGKIKKIHVKQGQEVQNKELLVSFL